MEQLVDKFLQYGRELYGYWLAHNLWTWRWWLDVALTILPWVIWILIRDKRRTWRLLSVAFLVGAMASFLDAAGGTLGLWYYPVSVIPMPYNFIPWDLCVLPVATMLFLQFFPRVNPFAKAAVYAVLGAFVVEPLSIVLGLYVMRNWSLFYTLPALYALYLLFHFVYSRLDREKC